MSITDEFGGETLSVALLAAVEFVVVSEASAVAELTARSGGRVVVPRRVISLAGPRNPRKGTRS